MTSIFLPRFLELAESDPERGYIAAEDLWEVVPEIAPPLVEALAAMPEVKHRLQAAILMPLAYLADPARACAATESLIATSTDEDQFQGEDIDIGWHATYELELSLIHI